MTSTAYLPAGRVISYQGVEYVITKVNPKKYQVARADLKLFNLHRQSLGIIDTERFDAAWMTKARQSVIERQAATVAGTTATDDTLGIMLSGLPRFKFGQKVIITGRGARSFEGKVGTIVAVNRTRYKVSVPGHGPVAVPFVLTRNADAIKVVS